MPRKKSKGPKPKKANSAAPPELPQKATSAIKVEACSTSEVEPKIVPASYTSPPTTSPNDAIPPAEIEAGRTTSAPDGPSSEAATPPPEGSEGYPLGEEEPLPATASEPEPEPQPEAATDTMLQLGQQVKGLEELFGQQKKVFEEMFERQHQEITRLKERLKEKDGEITRLKERLEKFESQLAPVIRDLCRREIVLGIYTLLGCYNPGSRKDHYKKYKADINILEQQLQDVFEFGGPESDSPLTPELLGGFLEALNPEPEKMA